MFKRRAVLFAYYNSPNAAGLRVSQPRVVLLKSSIRLGSPETLEPCNHRVAEAVVSPQDFRTYSTAEGTFSAWRKESVSSCRQPLLLSLKNSGRSSQLRASESRAASSRLDWITVDGYHLAPARFVGMWSALSAAAIPWTPSPEERRLRICSRISCSAG